jgi:putative redox protein
MDAKVIWNKGMQFTGSANSGFNVTLDAGPSVGGADSGFSPLELLAIGLAGCTAMDVISILRKKKQDVTAFDVRVETEQQAEHPHVFTAAKILYTVSGRNVDETAVRRAIELSTLKYCPAQAMLSRAFPMQMLYEIYNDKGKDERQLVKQGRWLPPIA